MIISKTPYRISFFGGGSDYPEWYLKNSGEVISSTINKYIYISCRNLPLFFKHKYRIVYSKIEQVEDLRNINHQAVREALLLFNKHIKSNLGLEIHYDGDLPSKSGMGSSSAFVVGMLNLLNFFFLKKKISKKNLTLKSLFLEQKILKETVGSQDQTITSYGGFNSIKFLRNGEIKVTPIIKNLKVLKDFSSRFFLVFTGIKRTANYIAKTYVKKLDNTKKNNILEILQHVKLAKSFLSNNNFDDFGLLLNETWKVKKALSSSVSSDEVNFIYNKGINSGAIGGKLLGAGGGGFFLFYVPKDNQKFFIKNMEKLIVTPVVFENNGSQIIHGMKE
jgi:D-glycero-alpha-D-manno-heptose-7-phosphate kinase